MQCQYSVPRYLGFNNMMKNSFGDYEVELGYTKQTQKKIVLDEDGLNFLEYFLEPKSIANAVYDLNINESEVRANIEYLKDQGVIRKHNDNSKKSRYDRHLLYYDMVSSRAESIQEKISKSRIALVGMGGIGNWVSLGLIGAGFQEIKLIDFDKIELSNLTRQVLFDENDINKNKVDVAKEKLALKNSDTIISSQNLRVKNKEDLENSLKGMDFVILSADSPNQIHEWLDQATKNLNIPYLNAGYRDGIGVVGPMTIHSKTSCYECHKRENRLNERFKFQDKIEKRYQAPSFGPVNAIVSNIAVLELLKYLGEFGELRSLDREININALDLSISEKAYSRDEECRHCGN